MRGGKLPRPLVPHPDHHGLLLVPLTRGKFAIIDAADAYLVDGHNWCAQADHRTDYAIATIDGKRRSMHSVILGVGGATRIDHKNRDGLDNRRANLRPANGSQNIANTVKREGLTSTYKGVCWSAEHGAWIASIGDGGRSRYLGSFDDEDEAAWAYDRMARELFGAFARLNFPRKGEAAA